MCFLTEDFFFIFVVFKKEIVSMPSCLNRKNDLLNSERLNLVMQIYKIDHKYTRK